MSEEFASSFEIEQTALSPEQRLDQGGVLVASELFNPDVVTAWVDDQIDNRGVIELAPMKNERRFNGLTGLFEKITDAGHLSYLEYHGDQEVEFQKILKMLLKN